MIRIIDAMEAHLPQVLEIEAEAISPPWSEGALTNELGREDGLFALAVEGGDVLGFIIVRRVADEAELYQPRSVIADKAVPSPSIWRYAAPTMRRSACTKNPALKAVAAVRITTAALWKTRSL